MSSPPSSPFDRLRELALRIPEGTRELLPLVDFLEAFPLQMTEEALVHLVGVTALGIAKSSQGGLWDGRRWLFLRGNASAFPLRPGSDWVSLPWAHGDEVYGHLVVRTPVAPQALELLLSISAPLLAWRRLEALRSGQNRALALQFSRQNTLFDLTRNLGGVETKQELMGVMVNTLAGEFQIQSLLVLGADGQVAASRGLGALPVSLEPGALQALIAEHALLHVMELWDQDRSHGFIYAAESTVTRMNEEDELFLQTLLNIVSGQLTAMDLRESRIQAMRMEKDLEIARDIQQRLLPKHLHQPEGWECAAVNLPYQVVGGDLYDLWMALDPRSEHRWHLAVGDISGKGLPASLVMVQLSAFLRAMADHRVNDWGALAQRLNGRMNEVRDKNRYATLFAASLNPVNGHLRYVNAGHNPPLLIPGNGGPTQALTATGPIIGLLPGAHFCEGRASMQPGDTLLVFTDGVVEAEDAQGRDLGVQPLVEVVEQHPQASAEVLLELLLARTFEHLKGGLFRDDATLVVIRRKPALSWLDVHEG